MLSTAESFSLAALECMAMGCLVITSNAGAYPELIVDKKNGFLLDLFESGLSDYSAPLELEDWQYEKVAQCLLEIQASPVERLQEISAKARQTVEGRFSWKYVAERTVRECYSD